MQVKSIDGFKAICEAKGVKREVSLFMMQDDQIAIGDHVLIHVGYAIQKISQTDARTTWEALDQLLVDPE